MAKSRAKDQYSRAQFNDSDRVGLAGGSATVNRRLLVRFKRELAAGGDPIDIAKGCGIISPQLIQLYTDRATI